MILDVSRYQGYIDWPKVKEAGVVAAWIKATGEETAGPVPFKDSRFFGNWQNAHTVVKRGAYHFMDGGRNSATGREEAEFFARTVEAAGGWGELLPVVDVEWPVNGRDFDAYQLGEFIEIIRDRAQAVPMVYTGRWHWNAIPDREALFDLVKDCPLWLASYTKECPAPPEPWSKVSMWQYTSKGRVNGIVGDVDMNRLFVPLTELER